MSDFPKLPASLDLLQTSIKELADLLTSGELTSVALVNAYLANIERNNINGLGLRAIIQVAPTESVLAIAKGLDEERSRGKVRGPLHGIPILVKDVISTAPELGMATSAGNTALKASVVPGDAEVIKRLREAGAIILAKTNLTELSNYKGDKVPQGWSAVGGQGSSAYVKGGFENGGNALGSSSGSCVGVSAGFGAGALGTETSGSITSPASRAALYAIRPSRDLVPRQGIVPINWDVDQAGPIGSCAGDVAILLDGMTDRDDNLHPGMSGLRLGLVRRDFLDDLDRTWGLKGPCPAIEVRAAVESAAMVMRQAGADVLNVDIQLNLDAMTELDQHFDKILAIGFNEDINTYLSELKESPIRTLEELVRWNIEHSAEELPSVSPSQQILVDSLSVPGRNTDEHRTAKARSSELAGPKGLDELFDRCNLDAAVFAVDLGPHWMFVAAAGYASGTAPLGYYDNGMPFGLLFVVRPWDEEKLVTILASYEAIMPKRRKPQTLQ